MHKHAQQIEAAKALLEGTDKAILVILGDVPNLGLMASQAIKRINSGLMVAAGAAGTAERQDGGTEAAPRPLTSVAGRPIKVANPAKKVVASHKDVQDTEDLIESLVIDIQLGVSPEQLTQTHTDFALRAACVKYGLQVTAEEPERITKPFIADLYNAVLEEDTIRKAVEKANNAANAVTNPPAPIPPVPGNTPPNTAVVPSTPLEVFTAKRDAYDAANVALSEALKMKETLPDSATAAIKSGATKAVKQAEEQVKKAYEEMEQAKAAFDNQTPPEA